MVKRVFMEMNDGTIYETRTIYNCTIKYNINSEVNGVLEFGDISIVKEKTNIKDIVSYEEFIEMIGG